MIAYGKLHILVVYIDNSTYVYVYETITEIRVMSILIPPFWKFPHTPLQFSLQSRPPTYPSHRPQATADLFSVTIDWLHYWLNF